jgi:hypothetical protein
MSAIRRDLPAGAAGLVGAVLAAAPAVEATGPGDVLVARLTIVVDHAIPSELRRLEATAGREHDQGQQHPHVHGSSKHTDHVNRFSGAGHSSTLSAAHSLALAGEVPLRLSAADTYLRKTRARS